MEANSRNFQLKVLKFSLLYFVDTASWAYHIQYNYIITVIADNLSISEQNWPRLVTCRISANNLPKIKRVHRTLIVVLGFGKYGMCVKAFIDLFSICYCTGCCHFMFIVSYLELWLHCLFYFWGYEDVKLCHKTSVFLGIVCMNP